MEGAGSPRAGVAVHLPRGGGGQGREEGEEQQELRSETSGHRKSSGIRPRRGLPPAPGTLQQAGEMLGLPRLLALGHDLAAQGVERQHAEVPLARQRLQVVGGAVDPAGVAVERLPGLDRPAEPQPDLRRQGQGAADPAVGRSQHRRPRQRAGEERRRGRGGGRRGRNPAPARGSRWNRASNDSSSPPSARRAGGGRRASGSAPAPGRSARRRRRGRGSPAPRAPDRRSTRGAAARPPSTPAGRRRRVPRSRSSRTCSRSTTNAAPATAGTVDSSPGRSWTSTGVPPISRSRAASSRAAARRGGTGGK